MIAHTLLAAGDPLEHVLPHTLFRRGPIILTNQMLMALVAAIIMLLVFPRLFKRVTADAPRGAQNFFESILEFLRVEVFRPALKEHTDRFVPFLWTLFFFILFCNLLGLVPINEFVKVLSGKDAHFAGTATGAITTTGALAICAFLCIHANGIWQVAQALMAGTYGHHDHHEEHSADGSAGHEAAHDLEHVRGEALPADVPGDFRAIGNPTKHYEDDESIAKGHHRNGIREGGPHAATAAHAPKMGPGAAILKAIPLYLWNFAPHPFAPNWIADVPMWLFLLLLEMVGAVIKPFALMIRLFANMIAGHIVLGALILLIPVTAGIAAQLGVGIPVLILSLLISMLELFVAFLQAYIFVFLTTLFIASAVAPEH